MYDRAALAVRLTHEESKRSDLYDDKTGKTLRAGDTIQGKITGGIGHNFSDRPLSDATIQFILGEDLVACEADLDRNIPWWRSLDDVRQSVMMDLEFNMGWSTLSHFAPTMALIRAGSYADAAQHLRGSAWYQQVGSQPGQRGYNLAQAMETGVLPS